MVAAVACAFSGTALLPSVVAAGARALACERGAHCAFMAAGSVDDCITPFRVLAAPGLRDPRVRATPSYAGGGCCADIFPRW
jgi:hypothetical protein